MILQCLRTVQLHLIDYILEREDFNFANPVEMTVGEKIQRMMAALDGRGTLQKTLLLSGTEISAELMQQIREALEFAAQYKLSSSSCGMPQPLSRTDTP